MGNEVTIPESKDAIDVEQKIDAAEYRSTMQPNEEIQPILKGIKAKINGYSNGTGLLLLMGFSFLIHETKCSISPISFSVTIVAHGIVQLFKSRPARGGKPASSFDELLYIPKRRVLIRKLYRQDGKTFA